MNMAEDCYIYTYKETMKGTQNNKQQQGRAIHSSVYWFKMNNVGDSCSSTHFLCPEVPYTHPVFCRLLYG
jgi:hypothetical protein